MTAEKTRHGQKLLLPVRLLIRLLSALVPQHRRGDWREEWEAELTCRWKENRGSARQRTSGIGLFYHACSAVPDAFHLFSREWVLDVLASDLRSSIRALIKHRAFSLVAVFTIALCIAANSTIFSVVNAVVLRQLPYSDSERILSVYNSYPEAHEERAGNSIPDYFDRRENIEAFEEVGLYSLSGAIIGEGEARRHAFQLFLTPSLFRVLGAQPHLGRLLDEGDGVPGNHRKVVISYTLWQSFFGGDQSVIGRDLIIVEVPHTVIGVLPEDFNFPTWDAVIWTPFAFDAGNRADEARYSGGPEMLAKLRPGSTIEVAKNQIDALNAAVLERYPAEIQTKNRNAGFHTEVLSFRDDLIRDVRTPLLLLWCGVLCVLLIACVNIANLLIVWTSSRSRDFAIRSAIGAGGLRIARQVVTESLSLAILGGGLGLLLSFWCMQLLDTFAVYDVPRMAEVALDLSVVGFTFLLILIVGLFAGLVPAIRLLRGDISTAYLALGRAPTAEKQSVSLQGILVSTQIAVTFMLTIGAGLMFASMRNVMAVDPGFDPGRVRGGAVALPWERYPDPASRIRFIDAAVEELRSQPGIENAAIVDALPFSEVDPKAVVTPENAERARDQTGFTSRVRQVSPSYFDVMEIPIVSGRGFTSGDVMDATPVAIVDEWLAARHWPNGNAIGARISLADSPDENSTWYTVVGIVGSTTFEDLTSEEHTGAVFRVHSQATGLYFFRFAMKTRSDPHTASPEVLSAIRRVDAALTPFWGEVLEDRIEASQLSRRMPLQLLLAASGAGLFLASLGIYGVLAHTVNQRTREIGVRMALGGTAAQILRLIGRHWIRVVGTGLLAGLAGALLLTRLMVSLLFGVTPTSPVVLSSAMLLLATVTSIAYLVPALRASRVDPVQVLNAE